MSNDTAIKVSGVSKTFKLPHEKNTSIKSAAINFYKRKKTFETQKVLNDVSFEIKKGEFFGIVGRNGSGKSTLLKLLAGIYNPTSGSIQINGKLTPFIELGVGFNMELTGRENVFLNGALLGFSRKEMEAMYDEIVEFAELEKFMDQKLKNYSSGMQVRLAFSIAIRAQTDILLIDEVLAVGDTSFQQKCYEVFSDLKKAGKTIILVTHDMSAVFRFCNKALLINDGVMKGIGEPKDIADEYLELNYQTSGENHAKNAVDDNKHKVESVTINGISGKTSIKPNKTAKIEIKFKNEDEQPLHFGFQIFNEAGNYCFGTNTLINGIAANSAKKGLVNLEVDLALVPGNYTATTAIMNQDATSVISYRPNALSFRISKDTEVEGIANLSHKWS